MNRKELWNKFLETVKELVDVVAYETWFNTDEIFLYSYDGNIATLVVKHEFIKKHMENSFSDVINEVFAKV